VETTLNDLFIPARTLSTGLYELQLTATVIGIPVLTSSSSVYIEIIQPIIMTNLVLYDTPTIKHDYQQNLLLNPGEFSIDLNGLTFNTNVSYLFQCKANEVYLIIELDLFILLSNLFNELSIIQII
jgi:hypothetical protein